MTKRSRLAPLAALGLTLAACDLSPRGPKEAEVGVAGDQRRVDTQTPDRGVELQEDHQTSVRGPGAERAIRPPSPGGPAGGALPAATSWPSFGSTGRLPPTEGPGGPARPRLARAPGRSPGQRRREATAVKARPRGGALRGWARPRRRSGRRGP